MELKNVNEIRERLIEAIGKASATPTAFARQYGLEPSYLTKKLNGVKPVTRNDIRKLEASPVNTVWLMTGEGEMFKDGFVPPSRAVRPKYAAQNGEGVPLYDVDFALGFVDFYNDERMSEPKYVVFPGTRGATCWVRTTGDSMSPEIYPGDYICLKKVEDWNTYLNLGEIYAIETVNDMRTVKRIERGGNEDTFTLVPSNSKGYSKQEIRKDFIRQIFKVVMVAKQL